MPDRDDDSPVAQPEQERARGTAVVLAVTLAVVFGVATIVLAVLLATRDADDGTDDVRAIAGRFGEALVTYDFHDPEGHRDAVLTMSTGSFRDEYERAFDQGLGQIITEVQATSTGYVKDIYLSAIDSGQVQAVVVADIDHTGAAGENRLFDVYFRLTLVKVDGEWLIDDVTDLNFGTGGGASPTGGSSTTSTLPPEDSEATSVP